MNMYVFNIPTYIIFLYPTAESMSSYFLSVEPSFNLINVLTIRYYIQENGLV